MIAKQRSFYFVNPWLALMLCVMLVPFASARPSLPEFADLIEQKSPAVVKITVEAKTNGQRREFPFPGFRQFEMPERNISGMGSGFIVSADGYVVTNNHVIEDADKISVRLTDRRDYTATVVGTDSTSDLALLKIDAKDLPFLKFANSNKVRVGEWVLAIGSPFGMDFSASQGIVSAMGRSIPTEQNENYVPFIQTDVAINPGNSGGPLFNLDGEVVGVNSQIFTRSGGYMGLSFAVPSNLVINVVDQLKDKGQVERGWLGVQIQNVEDQDLARVYNMDAPVGALVSALVKNSPAERAGIKANDIILEFDGAPIKEADDLPHVVGLTTPGKEVPVKINRAGRMRTLNVTIDVLGSQRQRRQELSFDQGGEPKGEKLTDRLGLVVAPLSPEQGETYNFGVQIMEVAPESAAARSGIRKGDVLAQLDFTDITDESTYRDIVAKLPTGELRQLRFFRDGNPVIRTIIIEDGE